MNQFDEYVTYLTNLMRDASKGADVHRFHDSITSALDGEPSRELRRLVPAATQKSSGAYFTGSVLANYVSKYYDINGRDLRVVDPACGSGDLLISFARYLPVRRDLHDTLEDWGNRLEGYDIYEEFIYSTKLRLILLALSKGARKKKRLFINKVFPLIRKKNFLEDSFVTLKKPTHIVLNPPYINIKASNKCSWATPGGNVSAAAVFVEKCFPYIKNKTKLTAILPDVLRAGSRYVSWRKYIGDKARIRLVEVVGQFEPVVDVDVFLLRLERIRGKSRSSTWAIPKASIEKETVGDLYHVHVGPVVPHRDPETGPRAPFICARSFTKSRQGRVINRYRCYSGKLFKPPFVVVKRTSRPDDKKRVEAFTITGDTDIAVENHLLVLKPRKPSLMKCKFLVRNLKSAKTREWLNKRIRCRHLTVAALKELPIWDEL